MERHEIDLVKQHWSQIDCSESEKNFYSFPPIRARSCKLIFNEDDILRRDWCEFWTVEKYLKNHIPFEKCLSICCGFGEVERILAKLGVAKRFVGIDIAEGAIEEARKRAQAENISNIDYYISDFNQERIPKNEYDLIYANGALHHLADLQDVVPMLYNALRPGGYLISNEYVGPRYQQVGIRQQELINAAKHILPPDLRRRDIMHGPFGHSMPAKGLRYLRQKVDNIMSYYIHNKVYEHLWEVRPMSYFIETDPSECVSSNKIVPVLKQSFDDVEMKYYNGSILSYALDSEFYSNFDIQNENHIKILELLFIIEDTLTEVGEIEQDNAHIICRKSKAN